MPEAANDKATLRSRFVNNRSTLGNCFRTQASERLVRQLLDVPELTSAGTVCAYQAFGTEPTVEGLLEQLAGRGGGSYDRALARTPALVWTCALVYDHELGAEVPVEPHDQPVRAACAPSGLIRFR